MTTQKKPFEKRYKTIVPVLRPAGMEPPATLDEHLNGEGHPDYLIARWLGRESFELTAAGDRLDLVEYSERLVPIADVNPLLGDALGRPVEDFDWFELSGLGRLDQDKFDWFAAEFVWHCEQWLEAERAHFDAIDDEHLGDNAEVGT